HIDKTFEKMESLPIISIFSANPDLGYGSLNSYFTIVAYDTDGDDLTCTLDFGDGSSEVSDSCEDLNGISHLYTNVGVYNVNLRVTDGDNEVFDSLQVEVKVPTDSKPKVISFTLDSSNGGFVPTDLTFNWKAIHPYSKPMTCTLYINNDNYNVPCEGSFNKYDYGIEGLGVFTIKADDGMYSDSRIIQKTFVKKHEEEKPPVIDLFVVSPSYGVEKLTSYFTIKVHDENGDALTCILDFGDLSIKVVDSCENLDGISHEYLVGDYNVQLTVKDGMFTVVDTAFVRVVEAADSKPVIEYFTLDSSNGYVVPTDLKFDWKVSHKYNKPMTCTLYVNSDSHIVPCVGSLTEFGYDIEGMGVFTLRATDGTYMDEKVIKKTFVRVNDLPVIDIFSANPKLGVGSLSSVFTVKVHDVNSDSLTCTLQFGDGSQVIDSCDNLDGVLHNYNNVGVYNAVLIVTDGKGASYAYERLEVVSIEDGSPVINWFIMSTETGDYTVSNNLTFNWDVSHPLGKSMICTLDINGDVNFIPCVGSLTEFDYDLVGQGVFTLRADDGMNSAQRVISQLFVPRDDENNTIDLSLDMISLIIDDVLVPGEFDFGIIVKNETLASRTLTFRPFITCNGVKAGLDEKDRYFDGYLDSHAISKSQRDENFVYAFKSDSRKYKAQIPTGTSCRFSVQVLDKYGTDIEVSKGVMFKYPEDARSAQSIRGNGLDIMNYMNSVVTNSIQKGYNSIEFDIENKDGITRDISITMISRELGINYHVEAKLGPGQRKNIQIPLFIDGDVEAGKYLLRLGVNDGSDKQVRYTKVNIN
ncbi:MAG: PKD domain-containing protein, partial [Nanoarchaeota archaeon]|nr:PKD domain-containing protein [Nanoarchaeota archaeon]